MLEEKALQSLKTSSQQFRKLLGEPLRDENGFLFPTADLPLSSFRIRYDTERKFLGKIFVMVVEGAIPGADLSPASERVELRYSGFIRKGKPYFVSLPSKKAKTQGHGVLPLLNGDSSLIEQCWKLEIEFLRLFFDLGEKIWKVQVRPYGGSFIKIVLPPLHYHVALVQEQAELIVSVMKRIGELLIPRLSSRSSS
jgi:hypothetical protein